MDPRWMARTIALGRTAIGSALLVAPRPVGRLWLGDSDDPGRTPLVRALGVRDLMLGLGALRALDHEGDPRSWVIAGGVSDAVDAVAIAAASPGLPARAWSVFLLAATAAGLSGRVASDL